MVIEFHDVRREVWQDPAEPITSDRLFSWAKIDKLCIHYTGAFDEDEDPYGATGWEAMRNVQRVYLNRGYSFGYSYGIHPDEGVLLEGRGTTYRAASNGMPDNEELLSVIVFVDDDKKAPAVVVERIRRLVADIRKVKPELKIVGHQDLAPTGCPGAGLQLQVVSGEFEPVEGDMGIVLLDEPLRVYDSRDDGEPFGPGERRRVQLTEDGDGPVTGAILTLTAAEPADAGYATLWANGARPLASTLNFNGLSGAIANTTLTKVDGYGGALVFSSAESHYVVDVIGWLR